MMIDTSPSFKSQGVAEALIHSLERQGVARPTDIQLKAYPVLAGKQDAWLSSSTGSGKTLAYLLPLLAGLELKTVDLQLAILVPTHELAVQIHDCLRLLYQDIIPAPRTQLLIGNASSQRQKEKLKKKPHVVVGSCGRMLELGQDRKLKLHKCRRIVIDEADRMLDEKGVERIEQFLKMCAHERQLIFVSATDKSNAFTIAQQFAPKIEWLQGEASHADPNITHYYIKSVHHHKSDALRKLLHAIQPEKAIVFLHRNETAELIHTKLANKELDMVVIHGGLNKFERQKALSNFRRGKVKILVSSDIAARGLDIKQVTHIINLDAPSDSDDYLHRAGRTGRMGASGVTISVLAPNEVKFIKRYQHDLNIKIAAAEVREGEFFVL